MHRGRFILFKCFEDGVYTQPFICQQAEECVCKISLQIFVRN